MLTALYWALSNRASSIACLGFDLTATNSSGVVYSKTLEGIRTASGWSPDNLKPYIEHLYLSAKELRIPVHNVSPLTSVTALPVLTTLQDHLSALEQNPSPLN